MDEPTKLITLFTKLSHIEKKGLLPIPSFSSAVRSADCNLLTAVVIITDKQICQVAYLYARFHKSGIFEKCLAYLEYLSYSWHILIIPRKKKEMRNKLKILLRKTPLSHMQKSILWNDMLKLLKFGTICPPPPLEVF